MFDFFDGIAPLVSLLVVAPLVYRARRRWARRRQERWDRLREAWVEAHRNDEGPAAADPSREL